MRWREFKALGSGIAIMGEMPEILLDEAQKKIEAFEKDYSRFIAGNKLDRLNQAERVEADEGMIELLRAAKHFYQLTDGIFDPTIARALESAGYDKSFELLAGQTDNRLPTAQKDFLNRVKFDELIIDGNGVNKPQTMKLDLGGIGKGFIVDQLDKHLFADVGSYWLSAGGDMMLKGKDQTGHAWQVKVQNPGKPEEDLLTLQSQGEKMAIATSGIIKRRGADWHHLIDPRTGLPVANNILSVTVVASSVSEADVFAKTVLILGEQQGLGFIEKQGAECIIFKSNGELIFSKNIKKFLV